MCYIILATPLHTLFDTNEPETFIKYILFLAIRRMDVVKHLLSIKNTLRYCIYNIPEYVICFIELHN